MIGALLLIGAIVLLTVAPRRARNAVGATAAVVVRG
jgi:hypothetical protein